MDRCSWGVLEPFIRSVYDICVYVYLDEMDEKEGFVVGCVVLSCQL